MNTKIRLSRRGSGGIRTHASEETGALNQRLRPLGHATNSRVLLIVFAITNGIRRAFFLGDSIKKIPWRNGSAPDSRSGGCVFESRRDQRCPKFGAYSEFWVFCCCKHQTVISKDKILRAGVEPATYGFQLPTTVHRSTN